MKKSRSKSVKKVPQKKAPAADKKDALPKREPSLRSKSVVKKQDKPKPAPKVAKAPVEEESRGRTRRSDKGKIAAATESNIQEKAAGLTLGFSTFVAKDSSKPGSPVKFALSGLPETSLVKPKPTKAAPARSLSKVKSASPMKGVSPVKKSPVKKAASPAKRAPSPRKSERQARSKTVEPV